MARFQVKSKSSLKAVGSKVIALARMNNRDYGKIKKDANNYFADVLDVPAGIQIKLVRDDKAVRHVVVPHYPADPAESTLGMTVPLWTLLLFWGCGIGCLVWAILLARQG